MYGEMTSNFDFLRRRKIIISQKLNLPIVLYSTEVGYQTLTKFKFLKVDQCYFSVLSVRA